MPRSNARGPATVPSSGLREAATLLGVFFALLLLGCGGSDKGSPEAETALPGPTGSISAPPTIPLVLVPTPAPTALPTVEATSEPTAVATSAPPTVIMTPTTPATATRPVPTVSLAPITLTVTAGDLEFIPASLTIPAHVVVTLVMVNDDPGVPHDLGVNVVGGGRTDTCAGPCTSSFVFAAHEPGSYHFFCSLHPQMVGDLRVTE